MKKIICFSLCLTLILSLFISVYEVPAEAKSKPYKTYYYNQNAKIGNIKLITKGSPDSAIINKIVMKKGNRSYTVAKKAYMRYVTNGKYLFYATYNWNKSKIIKVNLNSLKKDVIAKRKNGLMTLYGIHANYMYMGYDFEADGVDLYAMNMKTHAKQFMRSGVSHVEYKGNVVLTTTNSGDVWNYPIVIFSKDGKNKRHICSGITASFKGKYIYYLRCNNDGKFRVFRSNLKGKNKKAVTGWRSEYPYKYFG